MRKSYFNWKLASVLVIGLFVLAITAYGLRQWQRDRRAERGLVLGQKAYEEHRWEDAAKHLGRYLAVARDDAPVLLQYANAQLNIRPLKRSNVLHAVASFRAALRIDKNNSEAAGRLTRIYLALGMPGEAELIARRQLENNQDPGLRTMLAVALAQQRKFDEAAAELKDLTAKHPDHIPGYEILGQLSEQLAENFAEPPAHWFNEAVRHNPSSALAYIIRAAFYLKSNSKLEALADLKKAEQLDLSDLGVQLRLAREFMNADALEKAEEHLALARMADPSSQALWQTWAELALKSQVQTKMLEIAETGLKELSSGPWDFMPTAAELYIQSGRYDRAADCIRQLRQKGIDPAATAFLEGLMADRKGQGHQAVKHWCRAIELGDRSSRTRLLLASTLARLGDTQSALRRLRTLVSERPRLLEGRLALARLLAANGNWAETAEQARRAMQLSPQALDPALLNLQARIELLAGRATADDPQAWQQIGNQLAALEKAAGGSAEVKFLQLNLLLRQRNFARAEELLAELKKADLSTVRTATAEAELLAAKEKTEEAILILSDIVQQFPQAAEGVEYLAILLARHDRRARCEAVVKDGLTQVEEPTAQRRLALLLAGLYHRWEREEEACRLLTSMAQKLPADIPLKRRLLRCRQVLNDREKAQKIVDEIESLEGDGEWQWRYEQARVWFVHNFEDRHAQIISFLQENLLTNPDDQASRMLLAAAYERAGELQLAVSTYRDAVTRAPDNLRVIIPAVAALYKAKDYDEADEILDRVSAQELHHPQLKKLRLQSCLRRGRLSSASDILEDLFSNDPNNSAACLSLALLKMRQKEFDEASDLLAKLQDQEPYAPAAKVAKIELKIRQGMSAEALSLCDEIVTNFNNASAYMLRGRVHVMLGMTREAENDLEHAAALEPNNVTVWAAKSGFYLSQQQTDRARADIEKALSLAPNSISIRKRAVALFLTSRRNDTVRRGNIILDEALKANPQDSELRILKARSLLAEGTAPAIRKAIHILQDITEDTPKTGEAWVLLGETFLRNGELGKAIDAALCGLAHTPGHKSLLLLKARAEAERSPPLAIPTLRLLRESDPNNIDVAVRLADTYVAANQPERAVDLLTELQTTCAPSDRRKCEVALAVALYKSGRKADSKNRFDSLYKSAPDNPDTLLAQARLLQDENLWTQLSRKIETWCHDHPENIRTPVTIARRLAAVENGQAGKTAENIVRKILRREPNCLPALYTLAMILQATDRLAESARIYERILEIQPDNVVAINNLAWAVCEGQGQHRKALELAQRGLQKAPDYIDLIDTRGVTYYRLGQFDKAARDFDRCIRLYPARTPSVVTSYFHLGRALMSLGQKSEAAENLKKAFELNTEIGGLSPSDAAEAKRLIQRLSQKG
ncbi:MAG: tetratricopeptide repeat protein [Planctomycetota bacterium]|jgi:tetratricopeptide (TPR) repeat protein